MTLLDVVVITTAIVTVMFVLYEQFKKILDNEK